MIAQIELFKDVDTNSVEGLFKLGANLLSILFWAAGAAAVIIIIYAGIQYISSSGDPAGIAKAKGTIINAVIGLVLVIFAFAIVNLIVGRIT